MNRQSEEQLGCELLALSVFRNILNTDTMQSFIAFLTEKENLQNKLSFFGKFVYSLADYDNSFSKFLCDNIFIDENKYVVSITQKKEIPQSLSENTKSELKLFSKLSTLTTEKLFSEIEFNGYIPKFENNKTDFIKLYNQFTDGTLDKIAYELVELWTLSASFLLKSAFYGTLFIMAYEVTRVRSAVHGSTNPAGFC